MDCLLSKSLLYFGRRTSSSLPSSFLLPHSINLLHYLNTCTMKSLTPPPSYTLLPTYSDTSLTTMSERTGLEIPRAAQPAAQPAEDTASFIGLLLKLLVSAVFIFLSSFLLFFFYADSTNCTFAKLQDALWTCIIVTAIGFLIRLPSRKFPRCTSEWVSCLKEILLLEVTIALGLGVIASRPTVFKCSSADATSITGTALQCASGNPSAASTP